MGAPAGRLGLDVLGHMVQDGSIDTVVLAFTDMQGRLQGKRCHGRFFMDEVAEHGTEACDYLLATDVAMNTVRGYDMSSWDRGYGDFVMRPDLSTLRLVPWQEGTAICLADGESRDGRPLAASPRQVLQAQLARLAERGWTALAATELEFVVFRQTYEEAWNAGYRDLTPANLYNVDYSLIGTARIEELLRRLRNEMAGAGLEPESVKGECHPGQHEIAFRYSDALTTADQHSIYRTGAKEIAAQQGMSLTFMAKLDQAEGNSCHLHFSLRDQADQPVFSGADDAGWSAVFRQFLAGVLSALPDLMLLFAPNVNSYKRFAPGSFAPTAVVWGNDNRTCALRVVGQGPSLRVKNRVPGGDVNPYLALAAMVAAGLYGIDNRLELGPELRGNAYEAEGVPRIPLTLRDAADLFECSSVARKAFGDDAVDHYVNAARVELAAYDAAVTDWELIRGFERL